MAAPSMPQPASPHTSIRAEVAPQACKRCEAAPVRQVPIGPDVMPCFPETKPFTPKLSQPSLPTNEDVFTRTSMVFEGTTAKLLAHTFDDLFGHPEDTYCSSYASSPQASLRDDPVHTCDS